jgi:hypothetical protein
MLFLFFCVLYRYVHRRLNIKHKVYTMFVDQRKQLELYNKNSMKHLLPLNQGNVSEWSNNSSHELLFHWIFIIKFQLLALVYKHCVYFMLNIIYSCSSKTLPWFKGNKSLHILLNTTCLSEKQQIPVS